MAAPATSSPSPPDRRRHRQAPRSRTRWPMLQAASNAPRIRASRARCSSRCSHRRRLRDRHLHRRRRVQRRRQRRHRLQRRSDHPSPLFSPTPTPAPTASGTHITVHITGLPKDAPKMNNPDPKAVATIALVSLRLRTDADVTLAGKVLVDYTLPKEQIGGRGFAVQLYHEDVKKKKTTDTFFGSYAKSKLEGTTLHFELDSPPLQIKKDETWLVVLYGDELPSASASPKTSTSGSPGEPGSPSASPSGPPSGPGSPSGSPSASPSASASTSPTASPTSSP